MKPDVRLSGWVGIPLRWPYSKGEQPDGLTHAAYANAAGGYLAACNVRGDLNTNAVTASAKMIAKHAHNNLIVVVPIANAAAAIEALSRPHRHSQIWSHSNMHHDEEMKKKMTGYYPHPAVQAHMDALPPPAVTSNATACQTYGENAAFLAQFE